jgi:hypothetical protein
MSKLENNTTDILDNNTQKIQNAEKTSTETSSTPTNNNQEQQTENKTEPKQQPQQINIIDAIRNYMKSNPLKILIGTPAYGGKIFSSYFHSTIELVKVFTQIGIPHEIYVLSNESLIPRARNSIVAKFKGDESYTHLLFIDADITFSWQHVVKLILMDKELSGGCYPKKMLNWDKVRHNLKKDENINDQLLLAKSVDYVFNPEYFQKDGKLMAEVQNGMVKVKDIGTGFMMIKRSVIDIMMYRYEDLKYRNNVAGYHNDNCVDYFYTLFDTQIDPKSKVYLSEDYLFCKRWLECGGDCWLDLSINLNHTGSFEYLGAVSLSIGELDTLNKDFQIAQKQNALKK